MSTNDRADRPHPRHSLIAIDVDGTLIAHGATLSAANKRAVAGARRAGIRVVLATGKSWPGVQHIAGEIGSDGPHIVVNGAKIVGLEEADTFLEQDICERALQAGRSEAIPWCVYMEHDDLYVSVDAVEALVSVDEPRSAMSTDPPAGRALKVLFCIDEGCIGEEEVIRRAMAGLDCKLVRTSPFFFEVMPPQGDKGLALGRLLEHLGIGSSECLAVGDAENDLPMFAQAGCAVAIATAPDEVKAAADAVVPAEMGADGVAWAIEHFAL
ncbi:MAG: HAD hydrolase family protein [Actinomycetota bacterium]